jgi:O-antigen/teichoic acid export membrane protein
MTSRTEAFSSVRMLANGSFWNGLGRVFALVVALIATPPLLHGLGIERWGLFTLVLALCSTFGILDLGISPALTRALAERIGTPEERHAGPLVLMGLATLTVSGIAGGAAGYALTPFVVDHVLRVPIYLRQEAIAAFRILAAGSPLIVLNAGMWGVLAGYQRFGLANIINLPFSILYYAGPLIALAFHADLQGVTISLVTVRGAQTVMYLLLMWRTVPGLRRFPSFDLSLLRGLLSIGAWMTLSNVLGSLILQTDRLIVASRLSLTDTSFYSAPLDLVLRLIVVPIAIATAFFPAVATSYRTMPGRSADLLRVGSLAVTLVVWPVCAILVAFPKILLALWLGPEIANASGTALLILGLGTYVACISVLPSTFTDAIGRPDVGAKIMLVQAVVFPPVVILMIGWFGIEGAAVAWTLRCIINLAVRLWVCRRLCPQLAPVIRSLALVSTIGTVALAAYPSINPLPLRAGAVVLTAAPIMLLAIIRLTTRTETLQAVLRINGWFARSPSMRAIDRS